jgi:FMN phosphatase YigB (HAD superfamily)
LQNSPKVLLHIGDNVERDLLAARRLGHQSLLYRPNGASRGDLDKAAEIGPNDIVASISEFLMAMSKNE